MAATHLRSGIIVLMGLALLYATPWDNWLVYERIWTYPPDVVIARLGYVPIEEYLFFVLQPILTGLWLGHVMSRRQRTWPAHNGRPHYASAVVWLLMTLGAAALLLWGAPQYRYLGMILVWVGPIFAVQSAVGFRQLLANAGTFSIAVLVPTLYLSIVDRVAIGAGIWHIEKATSTGMMLAGLPIEEALFFLVTNMKVVGGIMLWVWLWEADLMPRIVNTLLPPASPNPAPLEPPAQQRIHQQIVRPAWWIIGVTTLVFLLPLDVPLGVQLIPLLLSGVLLGLPHGAIDHLVPGLLAGRSLNGLQLSILLVSYISVAALVLGLWVLSPTVGFVFFIALTWWHWGLGDLHATLFFNASHFLNTKLLRGLTAFVRGGLPMLVPLLFFPADYQLAVDSIVTLFNLPSADGLVWFFRDDVRLVAGIGFAVALVATLLLTYRRTTDRRAWQVYALETLLLAAYFAIVPPFLAVGIYFCVWHAARHIARLMLLQYPHADEATWLRPAVSWFVRASWPLTTISLVMLVALALIVPTGPDDLLSLIALYLVMISALTLPHSLVVMWMDWLQGVWRPTPRSAP